MLIAIWAMTEDLLIGLDNQLPWRIKEELAHFRKTTLNKDILMGKNTYLSLPDVFDQRNIFILTKDNNFTAPEKGSSTSIVNDYEELIEKYKSNPYSDLYVCGGLSVYQQLVPLCDQLIVSIVKGDFKGNKYLTGLDLSSFKVLNKEKHEKFDVYYYIKN